MPEFSEKYDLTEQAFRHKQEERELQDRAAHRAHRMETIKYVGMGISAAAVLCSFIWAIYLYNTGPEEVSPQQRHRQEVELACLDKGGIILEGKCVFSEKSAKELTDG
jgi:hypothetical protein